MSSKDFNFLLDEFFIYHGLEDIEKNSINQDNELDKLMISCYEMINQINKIKSNIKITEKVRQIKQMHTINKYNSRPNASREILTTKNDKTKKEIKDENSNYVNSKKSLLIHRNIKRNSFCYFKTRIHKKSSKHIDVNALFYKKSFGNLVLKNNKSDNLSQFDKTKINDLKKYYSPSLSIQNSNLSISDIKYMKKDFKKENKSNGNKRRQKLTTRHFRISLLD